MLPDDITQRSNRKLVNCPVVISNFNNGVLWIGHFKPKHRVHFYGNAVFCNGFLLLQVDRIGADIHGYLPVDKRNDEVYAWPFGFVVSAQTKNNSALVLLRNAYTHRN